jgi:lipopolysaccharide cholinephosphotransferase
MSGTLEKYEITKKQSDSLYRELKFIHDTLVKKKIDYFMAFGTLLGAVRHQGIIPHDDDGDICIFRKDVAKLRKMVNYFKKHGYYLVEESREDESEESTCSIGKRNCSFFVEPINDKHGLGVDIFIVKTYGKGKDKIVTYADPGWEEDDAGGVNCYFVYNHVFPLTPMRFGNFYLYGPHNPILNLNTCYGPDWNSKAQMLFDHRKGVWVKSKKAKMTVHDFKSIKAPKDTCDSSIPEMKCTK